MKPFIPAMMSDATLLIERVRAAALSGLQRRLQVPEQSCALIYEYGVLKRQVNAGNYTLDSLLARLNRLGEDAQLEAVLVRLKEWVLPIDLTIRTAAGEKDLIVQLILQVESPGQLVAGLLAGRDQFYQRDIIDLLRPALLHEVGLAIVTLSTPNPDLKALTAQLRRQLTLSQLPRWGLAQVDVRVTGWVQRAEGSDEKRLRQDHARERLQAEHEEALTDLHLDSRLGRDGRTLDHQLQSQRKTGTVDRQERIEEAQTEAEIATIQIGTEGQQLEMQLRRQKVQQQHLEFLARLDRGIDEIERERKK